MNSCPIALREMKQQPSQVLCKAIEPEEKRRIIGDTFIRLVEIESKKRNMSIENDDVYLAQGTLRIRDYIFITKNIYVSS